MGRLFEQVLVAKSDNGEETLEDRLTQDLVKLWEVYVNQYVWREVWERAVPKSMVRSELLVNHTVVDLLGIIPRL